MLTPAEITTLRSIKKTAVVILLLFRLDRPVTVTQLAGMLEIDRGTASNYLNQLRYQGIVAPAGAGWVITRSGVQLMLPDAGKIPASTVTTTATTAIGREQQYKAEVVEGWGENPRINVKDGENFPIDGEKSPILDERCSNAMATLADYGISDTPTVTDLVLKKDYITSDYIDRQAARLENERRFSTSLLITVLRCGDPLPIAEEEKHRRSFRKYNL